MPYESCLFLPTPSARRATPRRGGRRINAAISTHALREEGDDRRVASIPGVKISTHALREEGDFSRINLGIQRPISTHALREEGDALYWPNPHLPHAISTHALREEGDSTRLLCLRLAPISTHALREEGDIRSGLRYINQMDFYPRPPRGGRLLPVPIGLWRTPFLPTPSARRATK